MRRPATLTAVVVALLAIPVAASAHPGFNPSEVPPDEAVESTLVVPHGCATDGGMPEGDAGDAQPTVELALQHTDEVAVEPHDVDGWTVTDDGEAWVWSDDGGGTTDVIELPVTLTVGEDVAVGDELYLRAFQECADGSALQWIGTPDEEASNPAIRLTVGDGAAGAAEPDQSTTTDHGETEHGEDDGTTAGRDVASDGDGDGDAGGAEDDAAANVDRPSAEDAPSEDGGLAPALVALVAVALCAAIGAVVALRRRRG